MLFHACSLLFIVKVDGENSVVVLILWTVMSVIWSALKAIRLLDFYALLREKLELHKMIVGFKNTV